MEIELKWMEMIPLLRQKPYFVSENFHQYSEKISVSWQKACMNWYRDMRLLIMYDNFWKILDKIRAETW